MEKYRFDHAFNKVYEYNHEQMAYLFAGNLFNETEAEWIEKNENAIFDELLEG